MNAHPTDITAHLPKYYVLGNQRKITVSNVIHGSCATCGYARNMNSPVRCHNAPTLSPRSIQSNQCCQRITANNTAG